MPVWMVKATWIGDEAEASEQWEVSADAAHSAVVEVTSRLRFHPHPVEARLCSRRRRTRLARPTSSQAVPGPP